MKATLLAFVFAAALVVPARAQDSAGASDQHDDKAPAAAAAPEAAPAAGQPAGKSGDAAQDDTKLYLKLKKGGEVVFKEKAKSAAGKKKIKYRGYAKKHLEKYRGEAAKRLDEAQVQALPADKQAKAKELAAEAAFGQDVEDTVKEKMDAAQSAGAPAEDKDKLAAAEQAAKGVSRGIHQKMKDFEAKDAGGAKVFKEAPADGSQDQGQDMPQNK